MAEVKDKIITAESLLAVHEHNKETYMTKENPSGTGNLTMTGSGSFSGAVYVDGAALIKTTEISDVVRDGDVIPMTNGGTEATTGANGLKNLFADGATVLSSYQYGDTLPTAGTAGRIFFKKVTE